MCGYEGVGLILPTVNHRSCLVLLFGWFRASGMIIVSGRREKLRLSSLGVQRERSMKGCVVFLVGHRVRVFVLFLVVSHVGLFRELGLPCKLTARCDSSWVCAPCSSCVVYTFNRPFPCEFLLSE